MEYRGKSYKPIVFSRLQFETRKNTATHMEVKGFCSFKADSIQPVLMQRLIEGMWKLGYLQLLDIKIPLVDVKVEATVLFQETMLYKSLSPIVVPIQDGDRLRFCHPLESRFYDSVRQSAANWYYLKWGEEIPSDTSIHISLLHPEKFQLKKAAVLTKYKEKKLKGYQIPIKVQAPPKVQQVLYESGAGSYSSQGFGCLQTLKEVKE
ncbi:CRISPR-associated endoribonuclease Cas6 [Paenactinomyces guangxiensis]|uniref:CRISPR-associated endoribonuclease Cas6 n=1 Tax=Paenactinomyces guangxiensis TaxID=1490290 RepID=A0A7W2A7L5_9BACL|nr:CRISPR-associated endoribonuclease Cas6 [Paenactinomyces guangxiensis]MBA4493249.1 CRISPR-associated endoribonuclease Cas6 [Paenactinomyces guangxiensis]MBH8589900.1 CRISPR-associated endoribonuclease Cas6 [Paenactinomyces guangxiensis]